MATIYRLRGDYGETDSPNYAHFEQKIAVLIHQLDYYLQEGYTNYISDRLEQMTNGEKPKSKGGDRSLYQAVKEYGVELPKKDRPQLSENGGVDLTPANMNLQTQNLGGSIKFHIDPAMLKQLQNALGFVPVIVNIQPMTNLREFLGLKDQKTL